MDSSNQPPSPSPSLLPTGLLLSLATGPVLVGIVGIKAVSLAVQEFGLWSEELFRGDRLPILNVPPEVDPSSR